MNKQNKIIALIVAVLVLIISVTLAMNSETAEERKALNEGAKFVIKLNSEEVKVYTLKEIMEFGVVDFEANLKTNGKVAEKHNYTGVLLKDIYDSLDVDYNDFSVLEITAADGYTVMLSVTKLIEEGNIYLAYMRDGEVIGSMDEGGKGPIQMIISKDSISQYWCKYAISADLKE